MTMDGEDVTWEEYFYWLYYSGVQVNNYINQMAANMSAYGMDVSWDDAADDTGISFKDYVVQLAEENIRQIHSIKKFSAENDVTLTEDNLKAIEEQRKTDMVNLCGEEVSDEEFAEFLKSTYYLPMKVYDDMNEINYLYQNCFSKLYGENGEKLSDEKAEAYLKDSGYMNATHILFMTVDPSTGEALDDETIAEKKALADKFAAELAGIDGAIRALPEGYATPCADGIFSQGEWQLLSIARAAAANPAVLLLDEITANLDVQTEARVLEALRRASKGRTVLSISHRICGNPGGRTVEIKPCDMMN